MFSVSSYFKWVEGQKGIFVDLVRIYLGIGLVVRGFLFMGQPELLTDSLSRAGDFSSSQSYLMHLVALVHIGGGALLAIGLLTRIAALTQLPILTVAVFGVHLQEGLGGTGQSLEFSALVLFLLVIIFVRGSGPLSLDQYILERETELPPLPPDEKLEPTADLTVPFVRSIDEVDLDVVRARPVFRKSGWFALFLGVRASPVEVEFIDRETGEVVARTKAPDVLERYR
jgi:uncharacterized membrane protein YphA (DoxX/SURF4 family)